LHLETDRFISFDQPIEDGIDYYDLRKPWNAFWNSHNSTELVAELVNRTRAEARNHCIVTFPSGVVPAPEHLVQTPPLFLHVLYGAAADCIRAFLNREQPRLTPAIARKAVLRWHAAADHSIAC
jgi:hypothetical protein